MIDKAKISGAQFLFTVACYLQSTTLITSFFINISLHDSLFVILTGAILILPILFMYFYIIKWFPGKNLIQVNDLVFGKIPGKLISCFYLFFFFTLSSLTLGDLGRFVNNTFMIKTPVSVLIIVFIILCVWAVRNGLNVVTRYNIFFSILITAGIILDDILASSLSNMQNFIPIFEISLNKYIHATHIITAIPFGDVIVFLMIIPNVKLDHKKTKKYFLIGFFIGVVSLLLVVFREVAVFGDSISLFTFASYESIKLIKLGAAFTRLEILSALILVILSFSKTVLLFYVTVIAFAQIFNLKSFKAYVLSIGLLITIYSLNIYSSATKHGFAASNIHPFFWTFMNIILPFLTLLIILLRKLNKRSTSK